MNHHKNEVRSTPAQPQKPLGGGTTRAEVGYLGHEGAEHPELEGVAGDADEHLMAHAREEENEEGRLELGAAGAGHGVVHMAQQPLVHRPVPRPPVLAQRRAVPPIL